MLLQDYGTGENHQGLMNRAADVRPNYDYFCTAGPRGRVAVQPDPRRVMLDGVGRCGAARARGLPLPLLRPVGAEGSNRRADTLKPNIQSDDRAVRHGVEHEAAVIVIDPHSAIARDQTEV
jgi:hypothetical protein